jgi:hypothetical protein
MNKLNSKKIIQKNLIFIIIFVFLIFISKYSFSLKVEGLSFNGSYLYCQQQQNSNDCILSFNNHTIVEVLNDIYLDTDNSEELNLIIDSNNKTIFFIVQDNLNFGNSQNLFNSLIIKNSEVIFIKEEIDKDKDSITIKSVINSVYLENSILRFNNTIHDTIFNNFDFYANINLALENQKIIYSPSINFKNTDLFIDNNSEFYINFDLVDTPNYHFHCNFDLEPEANNELCDHYNNNNNGFCNDISFCYSEIPLELYPSGYLGVILYKKEFACELQGDDCVGIEPINIEYLAINADEIDQEIIFKNIVNNGVIDITNKGIKLNFDNKFIEDLIPPIIFLNYTGTNFPKKLDTDSKNMVFLKTCDDNLIIPNNYDYNFCSIFIYSPVKYFENFNNVISRKLVCKNTNNYLEPQNILSFNDINKTINPYLFGQIYDSNSNYYSDFFEYKINKIPISENNYTLNKFQKNNNFIFYSNDINLPELCVLHLYNISSVLNYNDTNINLNYGFSFFRN